MKKMGSKMLVSAIFCLGLFPLTDSFTPVHSRAMTFHGTMAASLSQAPSAWYASPEIQRDRSHVVGDMLPNLYKDSTRFVFMTNYGVLHQSPQIAPAYLTISEITEFLVNREPSTSLEQIVDGTDEATLLAWVGKVNDHDYWVLQQADFEGEPASFENASMSPLREFGDRLTSEIDAGILATANGLVEFHKSHKFCSYCGSRTVPQKAGACRRCVNCERSVYPRLDIATIMLITSSCGQYALLGRKRQWPKGRYSTLAGFAEVGETLEECCIRETFEESGVSVDPSTVGFVASQPWPFPRSVMVGFQGSAIKNGDDGKLPKINVDVNEMEDIQWFAKDYVKQRLSGGSTALGFKPNKSEAEFHIPGKSSLARLLITSWTDS